MGTNLLHPLLVAVAMLGPRRYPVPATWNCVDPDPEGRGSIRLSWERSRPTVSIVMRCAAC